MRPKILIVDDEPDFLFALRSLFSFKDMEVQTAESGAEALELIGETQFDAVISDMAMPNMTGLELLKKIRETDSVLQMIIMTGVGTIENAVEAIQEGAFHYVTKPFDSEDLHILVRRAVEYCRMQRLLARKDIGEKPTDDMVVGYSHGMREIFQILDRVADSDASILLLGETGTGKSMLAKSIHERSIRRDQPFLTIDCAALHETLLESEMFGHVKGSFTGAIAARRGLLEEAQGGTIFLDEIAELSPGTQVKLLRAIQEKQIKPVGGNRQVNIDVRFISATSRNLEVEIKRGGFREDLYYRLAVVSIKMPSLRDRTEDLPEFISHFVKKYNSKYRKNMTRVTPGVVQFLKSLEWRGNIRELENTIERAVLMSDGETFTKDLLGFWFAGVCEKSDEKFTMTLKQVVEDAEKNAILQALEETKGNRTLAAKMLGIGRRTLYDKIAAYEID